MFRATDENRMCQCTDSDQEEEEENSDDDDDRPLIGRYGIESSKKANELRDKSHDNFEWRQRNVREDLKFPSEEEIQKMRTELHLNKDQTMNKQTNNEPIKQTMNPSNKQ